MTLWKDRDVTCFTTAGLQDGSERVTQSFSPDYTVAGLRRPVQGRFRVTMSERGRTRESGSAIFMRLFMVAVMRFAAMGYPWHTIRDYS